MFFTLVTQKNPLLHKPFTSYRNEKNLHIRGRTVTMLVNTKSVIIQYGVQIKLKKKKRQYK